MYHTNEKNIYLFKIIVSFWFLFFSSIGSFFIIIFIAYQGYLGDLPSTEEIENPFMEKGSKVYDINGILLGKFFSENRILVNYKQLPTNLVNALLAKEDIRFKIHSGIDAKSILRALFSFGKKGGGSTISQQLAKLLFTGHSARNKLYRIHQKILEWVMAVELEKHYTKEEIIAMYYNKFDFLYNAKGIEKASHTYFNKKVSELNLGECATLVGMLENPSLYNPKSHPNRAIKQRNLVLFQMKKYHFLNKNKYKKELKKPMKINFKIQKKDFELLTYYGEFLKKETQKFVNEYEEQTGKRLNLDSGGLKIYTSIDSRMQDYAEQSVKKHLNKLQNLFNKSKKNNKNYPFLNISHEKIERIMISAMHRTSLYHKLKQNGLSEEKIIDEFKKPKLMELFTWNGNKKVWISLWDLIRYRKGIIQAGLLSIEASTGFIKAWVGGVDFNHFQYDHVAQTKRQVGSIFKPILYATAINQLNYNPCTKISNEKFQLGNWSPRNSNGKYGGLLTLRDGLALSVNTISARIIAELTPIPVIELAKKMGIESKIPENPSIALGSSDLTLYEITGAFNTFTNYGFYIKPSIIIKIEDKNGNLIKNNVNCIEENKKQVFNNRTAHIMLNLMKGVIEYGTARRLKTYYNMKGDIIGKTGTTNENSDGWFIGMIPNLTTGVWVGWEDRYCHFNNIQIGQGANTALPIWAYFIKHLYQDINLMYHDQMFFQKLRNGEFYWNQCEKKYNTKNYIKNRTINTNKIENNEENLNEKNNEENLNEKNNEENLNEKNNEENLNEKNNEENLNGKNNEENLEKS
ncbi:transglycosylase domain-containing protein [Blattabacterium cuenoti]|uniref:transglycosylase domain-containing protein n=1 Tax=Blattabacterium cuenoti TaxID=1653831 RepID=UPI00163CCAAF|nr:transglycosylase domain-containing protein [Blattabacterium cuenoti]